MDAFLSGDACFSAEALLPDDAIFPDDACFSAGALLPDDATLPDDDRVTGMHATFIRLWRPDNFRSLWPSGRCSKTMQCSRGAGSDNAGSRRVPRHPIP